MGHGIVVKIHSSRTGIEPTTSMAPTRLAMQGGHAIHYTISPSPKKGRLKGELISAPALHYIKFFVIAPDRILIGYI